MTGSPAITGNPKLSAATREERPAFGPGLVARFRWWQRRNRLREPLS